MSGSTAEAPREKSRLGVPPNAAIATMSAMEPSHESQQYESVAIETVRAGARGERAALRKIFQATSDRVYRLMVRMVGRQDADDLTQQVYLRTFEKLEQFAGDAKFETWLFRLASNEALQHLRRENYRRTQPLLVEPPSEPPAPMDREELSERLTRALEQLDPELRAVFSLKEEAGLSYRDISRVLDLPEGTIGSRLNRARRQLRELLKE